MDESTISAIADLYRAGWTLEQVRERFAYLPDSAIGAGYVLAMAQNLGVTAREFAALMNAGAWRTGR